MRPEIVAAERAKEVRDAARAWHRAGFVGEDVLARTLSLFPDDRERFGPGFRALAFIFTAVAVWAMVGLSIVLLKPSGWEGWSVLLLSWAVALLALTELQLGPLRRNDAGAESATAYTSVALAVGGIVAASDPFRGEGSITTLLILLLGSTCALCSFSGGRFGDRLFFAGSALSGFALLTQTGHGRLLWTLASLLLVPICLKTARDARRAPSHRHGAVIVGAVAILALYAAVHIWSFDQRLIEAVDTVGDSLPTLPFRWLSILATALLPPALFLIGWRLREALLLYAGLLLIFASVATIRLYREVMPLSFALILIGALCLALALWTRRWLRSGANGERDGFTADPLFDNTSRTEAIRSVVAMASFTPAAPAAPAQDGFEGGGGRFGGGGATGGF